MQNRLSFEMTSFSDSKQTEITWYIYGNVIEQKPIVSLVSHAPAIAVIYRDDFAYSSDSKSEGRYGLKNVFLYVR